MTTAIPDLTALRSAVSLRAPAEDGWDDARQAWNLTADQNPVAVAYVESPADVAAVVNFAREHGLRVAAQGTGHGATALAPLDGVVLIKTARMKGVTVDPSARRARVEAGVVSGELGAAAAEHGLAPLGGSSPDVGVIGFLLGGGIGWLSRRHGLSANAIRAAELVTADGEQVHADADQNTDLFWALRGGGGDFGVVTALELELFPIERVYAGSLMWHAEHGADVLRAYLDWIGTVPDELTTGIRFLTLPPIPGVPEPLRGVPVIDVTGAYDGDPAEGAVLLDTLRAVAEPYIDSWAEMPASGLSRIYGDPEEPVPGLTHHTMVGELPVEATEALVELAGPESGSPLLMVGTRHLGGALSRAPADCGALGALAGEHIVYGVGMPMAPGSGPAIAAHLDRMVEVVGPWATGGEYLNFADRPGDASRAFDADTLRRLRAIKDQVDPDNLFVAQHPVP